MFVFPQKRKLLSVLLAFQERVERASARVPRSSLRAAEQAVSWAPTGQSWASFAPRFGPCSQGRGLLVHVACPGSGRGQRRGWLCSLSLPSTAD